MAEPLFRTLVFPVASLARRREAAFDVVPDAAMRAALAADLGLLDLGSLRFRGTITPSGRRDWQLAATLEAEVTQASVVTLEPVTTRLHEDVTRRYLSDYAEPDEAEAEIRGDVDAEPLGQVIDAGAVLIEELRLALPLYPREADAAPEGAAEDAAAEDRIRPFEGLADLFRKGGDG
jgi:uncharacterized metal-binding protein YceD (DUF177 family)